MRLNELRAGAQGAMTRLRDAMIDEIMGPGKTALVDA